jgi:hypothetical protein
VYTAKEEVMEEEAEEQEEVVVAVADNTHTNSTRTRQIISRICREHASLRRWIRTPISKPSLMAVSPGGIHRSGETTVVTLLLRLKNTE